MGRYDLTPKDRESIADDVRLGDISHAVEKANRLIWDSLNRDPSGNRVVWMPMASEKRVREILAARPKILKSVPSGIRATLNFAAVIAELLGPGYHESEWLPKNLDLGLAMNQSAAVNMFNFCARHYEQIRVFAKARVSRVTISVCHNVDGKFPACAVCETLTGSIWTAETIPELPYEECVNSFGCRCLAVADV
jgi:hypothetical protein